MKIEAVITTGGQDDDMPINFASAVINYYMGNSYGCPNKNARQVNLSKLEEIAEHILTYVKHAK